MERFVRQNLVALAGGLVLLAVVGHSVGNISPVSGQQWPADLYPDAFARSYWYQQPQLPVSWCIDEDWLSSC